LLVEPGFERGEILDERAGIEFSFAREDFEFVGQGLLLPMLSILLSFAPAALLP